MKPGLSGQTAPGQVTAEPGRLAGAYRVSADSASNTPQTAQSAEAGDFRCNMATGNRCLHYRQMSAMEDVEISGGHNMPDILDDIDFHQQSRLPDAGNSING